MSDVIEKGNFILDKDGNIEFKTSTILEYNDIEDFKELVKEGKKRKWLK